MGLVLLYVAFGICEFVFRDLIHRRSGLSVKALKCGSADPIPENNAKVIGPLRMDCAGKGRPGQRRGMGGKIGPGRDRRGERPIPFVT
jgi:hypothetical protein